MAEIKFFYPNCDCCSGSGSSGSGPCSCVFYKTVLSCPSDDHCPTDYVATIRLNFSGCGSSPIGSCSSGSSGSSGITGSGPTTGGDFEPTGSADTGSDCRVCPDCCSIANKVWQINLRCVDSYLASDSFIDGLGSTCFGSNSFDPQTGSSDCLGFRTDRCQGGWVGLGGDGSSIVGWFILPLDGGFLYVAVGPFSLSNCNPFLMSGPVTGVGPATGDLADYPSIFPCMNQCLDSSYFTSSGWSCVTGTVTITEAGP